MNKDIKIYQIEIDYEDEELGILRNSFVDYPAVEYTKLDFKEDKVKNIISFSKDSSEQRFMSVSMVADTPIPRINEFTGEIYGIVFTKENIKKIVNKFVMDGNINEVSFQHTNEIIDGVYLVEHFITRKGVVEAPGFKGLPDGSWVTSYYVPDLELYNKLKNDKSFNGFSVEITAKLEEMFNKTEDIVLEEIKEILYSEKTDEEKEEDIKKKLNIKQ